MKQPEIFNPDGWKKVGKFATFDQWVNKASSWIHSEHACVDAKGRWCRRGEHFMRARDDGAFPVTIYAPKE